MPLHHYFTELAIRNEAQEPTDNLRGSMENSGQEMDTVGGRLETAPCPRCGRQSHLTTIDDDECLTCSMRVAVSAMKDSHTLIRNAALEEAAKVCAQVSRDNCDDWAALQCVDAIRALKS